MRDFIKGAKAMPIAAMLYMFMLPMCLALLAFGVWLPLAISSGFIVGFAMVDAVLSEE